MTVKLVSEILGERKLKDYCDINKVRNEYLFLCPLYRPPAKKKTYEKLLLKFVDKQVAKLKMRFGVNFHFHEFVKGDGRGELYAHVKRRTPLAVADLALIKGGIDEREKLRGAPDCTCCLGMLVGGTGSLGEDQHSEGCDMERCEECPIHTTIVHSRATTVKAAPDPAPSTTPTPDATLDAYHASKEGDSQ